MRNPSVRRICGLNLRVPDLEQAVAFYRNILGLKERGVFGKEAFLQWRAQGEDFLGFFTSPTRGWHHMELRLRASNAQAAFRDLQSKALLERLRSLGSSEVHSEVLRRWVAAGVETFTPLQGALLVAELADPDGRMLELVYLKEDYAILELPGLLAVEIETPYPDAVAAFYSQVGFIHTPEGLEAASGQKLLIRQGERVGWVRATLAISSQAYTRLGKPSRSTAGGAMSLLDPNGYELTILPEGGVTS